MDIKSPGERSRNMAAIRASGTKPELFIRHLLFSHGYRYRLYRKDLPGKPDITLSKHHAVIFVNGCFWHQHRGCRFASIPSGNREFWVKKLKGNTERDKAQAEALQREGWRVLTVWECACRKKYADELLTVMEQFIRGTEPVSEIGRDDLEQPEQHL